MRRPFSDLVVLLSSTYELPVAAFVIVEMNLLSMAD